MLFVKFVVSFRGQMRITSQIRIYELQLHRKLDFFLERSIIQICNIDTRKRTQLFWMKPNENSYLDTNIKNKSDFILLLNFGWRLIWFKILLESNLRWMDIIAWNIKMELNTRDFSNPVQIITNICN